MSWAGRNCIISVDPASSVAGDYTAISVISHTGRFDSYSGLPVIEISHLERRQQVHHREIVNRARELADWLSREKLTSPPTIVMDANGIGRAIVERARETFPDRVVLGFIATGAVDGRNDRIDDETMTVFASKLGHLSALDAAAQADRLVIPSGLKLGQTLLNEAQSLRTKISRAGRILVDEPDSRISEFDDILNSVSMGVAVSDRIWTEARLARLRGYWPDRMRSRAEDPIEDGEMS